MGSGVEVAFRDDPKRSAYSVVGLSLYHVVKLTPVSPSVKAEDMAQLTQAVQSKGIYHGLPVFPPDIANLSAIVVGASGISGHHMLQVLAEAPNRWSKVYALSRRLPACQADNIEHVSVDLLKAPKEIAQILRAVGVKAYVDATLEGAFD